MTPPWRWSVIDADLDPVRGSEQRGLRPVLVVSDEGFNVAMPNLTVLPLTSTERDLYPAEVLLPARVAGQPHKSIVMAHQVRTISKLRVGRTVGRLEDQSLRAAVRAALAEHLDLAGD
jgi:mRNA interferase MazF